MFFYRFRPVESESYSNSSQKNLSTTKWGIQPRKRKYQTIWTVNFFHFRKFFFISCELLYVLWFLKIYNAWQYSNVELLTILVLVTICYIWQFERLFDIDIFELIRSDSYQIKFLRFKTHTNSLLAYQVNTLLLPMLFIKIIDKM